VLGGPLAHVTLHAETELHVTLQVPVHWTSHAAMLVQVIVLPGPASTPQVEALVH
jgi:hypothetical protein